MNKSILTLAVALAIGVSSQVVAEDFIPKAAVDAVNAPGLEAQQIAAEQPYQQLESTEFVAAEDQLQEYLNSKGWSEGWDPKKKRMFVVVAESFDAEDPSYDDTFITKRSLYATLTTMGAKAKIAEYMRTQMSALDQLSAPGTDVHDKLNENFNKLQKKMAHQREIVLKLLREVERTEADKNAGVTWADRGKASWDALIKKLDEYYSTENIEAKKLAKYEKAKQRYDEASREMSALESQASALKGSVSLEAESSVETLAKAPILGAMVLAQAESWHEEEEQYQVASLLVWSPKLENAAKAILAGEQVKLKPKQGKTVKEWLQTQDLATFVGARSFVDKSGDRWFVGAYGMPYSGSSSLKRKNKGIAELQAKKEAVMAMYADLETQKQAKIALQTKTSGSLEGKDVSAVATSFAETTRQSIDNKQVNGLSKLVGKRTKHPLTGEDMYVVAYGISASSAQSALALEYSAFSSAAQVNSNNQRSIAQRKALARQAEQAKAPVSAGQVQFNPQPAPGNNSQSTAKPKTRSQSVVNTTDIDEDDF